MEDAQDFLFTAGSVAQKASESLTQSPNVWEHLPRLPRVLGSFLKKKTFDFGDKAGF